MQVLVPPTGGRVTLASDGVWDAHEKMSRVANMSRGWPLNAYPQRMIQVCAGEIILRVVTCACSSLRV